MYTNNIVATFCLRLVSMLQQTIIKHENLLSSMCMKGDPKKCAKKANREN